MVSGKKYGRNKKFYEERYALKYAKSQAYAYAICLKEKNNPIGYIQVDIEEPHDFGYALRKEFWHQGIVSEAAKAVVEQVKKMGCHILPQPMTKIIPEADLLCRPVV